MKHRDIGTTVVQGIHQCQTYLYPRQFHNTFDQNASIMSQLKNTQLELSNSIKQNAILTTQHYLNMAPSYEGKDTKQFHHWLDGVIRLAHQYNMPYSTVVSVTSRGSVHRCVKELISQNLTLDEIKVKLHDRFSECASVAAAQNKLFCQTFRHICKTLNKPIY